MENVEQINYNGLLMLHLNKLSNISTGVFIDSIDKNNAQQYVDPKSIGETALEWGSAFLLCLIPDELHDKKFKEDKKKYVDEQDGVIRNFSRVKAVVNLLNRKGLLIQQRDIGGFKNKKKSVINKEFEK